MITTESLHVKELTQRLAEAEATIVALMSGQIDAVVDARTQTPVLLAKAQEALRQERDRAQHYLDDLRDRTKMLEEHASALSDQAALLDLAQDAIIVRDMSNRIVFWNHGAEALYGWASDEALGRDKDELLQTRYAEPPDQIDASLLTRGAWEGEMVQHTNAGTPLNVWSRWTLQRASDERAARILTITNDITGRKRADAERARFAEELQNHAVALLKNEDRTAYALGAAHMGLWELNTVTQALTCSPTMAPVFGLPSDQASIHFQEFVALIHPDDRRLVETSLAQAAAAGTDFKEEFRVVWPDGSAHWIDGRARMSSGTEDGSQHWMGIGMDLGDRKALEAQFRQAQKMEAVGQLAGGIAHDFNNLLTSILGYSGFVMDTFGPQDRRRADMDEVVKAGQRAAGLTRQLLAFSRKQVLQPTRLDLNALVTGMHPMLSRLIGEQVELVPDLAADLAAVRADPGQLEQVLMNLVVNARDAMPAGGVLTIQTANVDLDQSFMNEVVIRPGAYVMLAVSDTGVGMTEDTKSRLFEPFFTTKGPGKGTGLGLATVYGIVKQSGGYVWVCSDLGKGTAFKVYLPCADEGGDIAPHVVPEHGASAGTETVLVVEDEEAVRLLTRRILEDAHYRVFDAPNPQQAEAIFDQQPNVFSLLVTDVIMPGSTGPKLFEQLVRKQPNLKVLYISGHTDTAIINSGEIDPAIELLQKPFSANSLKRRIREVLDGK